MSEAIIKLEHLDITFLAANGENPIDWSLK